MNNPVDVHVLLLTGTNRRWWKLCRESLRDEPINLHLVEGIPGHIGQGRAKGFALGKAPYVSSIDPDDLIVPGAFQACVDILENNPLACGAYTDELLIDQQGRILKSGIWSGLDWNPLLQLEPRYLHNVCVMRRCFVERYLLELKRWPNMSDFVLKGLLAAHGPWIHLNRFGYKWRMTDNPAHKHQSSMHIYAARWRIIPSLQQAAKKYQATIKTDGRKLPDGSVRTTKKRGQD